MTKTGTGYSDTGGSREKCYWLFGDVWGGDDESSWSVHDGPCVAIGPYKGS